MSDPKNDTVVEFKKRSDKKKPGRTVSPLEKFATWLVMFVVAWFVFMVIFIATYQLAQATGISDSLRLLLTSINRG